MFRFSLCVSLAMLMGVCSAASAQDASSMMGLFGGLVRQAVIEAAARQWQKLPAAVKQCMAENNMPVEALAAQGVSPADARVRDALASCESQNYQTSPPAPAEAIEQSQDSTNYNPGFVVNGLALGGSIHPDSDAYRSFKCRSSDQFSGYTICHRDRLLRGKLRSVESFLHSSSGTAYYVSQVIFPATFRPGDIDREIQRLSERFGLKPQILRSEAHPGFANDVIAYWGDISLVPLGSDDIERIRQNMPIQRGFLFDFYDNYKDSSKATSPIYQLTGKAGYVWGATYDDNGRGRLRFVTIDPSALTPSNMSASIGQNDASGEPNAAPTSSTSASSEPSPEEQARAEAEKRAQLESLITAAKGIVEDASTFVKTAPNNSNLLQYVREIAELSDAISQQDPAEIQRLSTRLANDLATESGYHNLVKARAAALARDEARYLGEAVHLAKHQLDFMTQTVRDDPTSSNVLKFLPIIDQLNNTQSQGPQDLAKVRSVTGDADIAIRGAGLYDKFVTFEASDTDSATQPKSSAGASGVQSTLPITDRNRFLIEGDLADVVLLYNSSASAPHIALNLRNEYVFLDGRAAACVLGKLANAERLAVKTRIMSFNPQRISGLDQRCDLAHLDLYDIIVAQRGEFLKEASADALVIIAALENQQYRKLSVITSKEMQEQADADQREIAAIRADVASGVRKGFGLILLKTGSSVVCLTPSEKVGVHAHLLLKVADKLAMDLNGDPSISDVSLNDAFIDTQKRQCGAIYADAAGLQEIDSELLRMNIPHSFSSVWITPDQLDAADKALQDQMHVTEIEAVQRAQKMADQEKLEAARNADESAAAATQQAALRAKYGGSAAASAAAIAEEVRMWTAKQKKGSVQKPTKQESFVPEEFPAYANWLSDQYADHWELEDINSEVADFGTATFKGRELETVVARVTVDLKNRLLGEYQKRCYLFGRINDAEFAMVREPFVIACDDIGDLESWEQGHQFASQWIVN